MEAAASDAPPAPQPSFAVGSEVELRGLRNKPNLNGQRGRVLPPAAGDAPGRVRVRLQDGLPDLCFWPENLTHVAAAAPPPPKASARLADLVRADVQQGEVPLRISRQSLRGAGLAEELIRCSRCSDATCTHYPALERTAPLRSAPLAQAELQLCCCECLVRAAQAARVPPEPRAVTRFVDACCMGAFQACSQLMGQERVSVDVPGVGTGKLY